MKANALTKRLYQYVKLKTVIPCSLLYDKVSKFESEINAIMDGIQTKLLTWVIAIHDDSRKSDAIKVQNEAMQKTCRTQFLKLREMLSLMIKREIQINDWTLAEKKLKTLTTRQWMLHIMDFQYLENQGQTCMAFFQSGEGKLELQ